MSTSSSNVRREIAHTRERMNETIDQIDSEIAERVSAAKQKVDVVQLVREHPWPALTIAVALGALIGGSGADEKAAAATAHAAKRAAGASSDAAKKLVSKVRERKHSPKADRTIEAESHAAKAEPGIGDRILAAASAPLQGAIDRILDEMRGASRELGERLARSGTMRRPTPTPSVTIIEVVAETREPPTMTEPPAPRAEDVVPVPPEMLPTEVDARADAVEALGGGTHEPPLAPGAGDLGARWA
jgi:hypothetical protein